LYFTIKHKKCLYSKRKDNCPFYLHDITRRKSEKEGGNGSAGKFNTPHLLIFFLISAIFIASCPKPANKLSLKENLPETCFKTEPRQYTIGVSNENRSIESFVIGEGYDVILIMASIHGDETAGTSLVLRLAEYLREHPITLEGRKVMIMPTVNPDGRERNSRYNSRGVDLNRNFSTGNRINTKENGLFPLSEPETRAIVRAIRQCKPNRIVAVHQPLACIDYDGPGRDLANHIAKYCDLPVRKLGAMPGSLGSYAGLMLDIPTVTLELPQGKSSSEYLWEQYGAALIAAILYPQPIDFSIHTALIPLKKQKACLGRCFFSCQ